MHFSLQNLGFLTHTFTNFFLDFFLINVLIYLIKCVSFSHNFTAFCLYLYLLFYDSHNTLLNYIKEKNLHVDKLLHCFTAFVCCQYKKKKTKSHLCYVLHLLYCFSQTHYELTPFTLFAFFFFGLLLNGIIFCKQNKSFGSQVDPSFFSAADCR